VTHYVAIQPLQEPFDLGELDDSDRVQISFNVVALKRPSVRFLDEIVSVLEAAGVGVEGTTIFSTAKATVPRAGACLSILATGGAPPVGTHNDGAGAYRRPGAQLIARAPSWAEASALADPLREEAGQPDSLIGLLLCLGGQVALERGHPEQVADWLAPVPGNESDLDQQLAGLARWRRHLKAMAEGRPLEALATIADEIPPFLGQGQLWGVAVVLRDAATIAADLGASAAPAAAAVAETCATLPPSARLRALESQLLRLGAAIAGARGDDDEAGQALDAALARARSLDQAFFLGPVLLDTGRWLLGRGRHEEGAALLAEARTLFERMEAVAWLERIDAVLPAAAPA